VGQGSSTEAGGRVAEAADEAFADGEPQFAFADYRLFPTRRTLFKSESEILLRGREFDLLVALLENAGTFIGNDALIARVWPTSTVSESNLRVQVASLRRALGDNGPAGRMIVNVTGRGYSFAIPVARGAFPSVAPGFDVAAPDHPRLVAARPPSLPIRLTGLVGRDATLARLQVHLPHRRLMTIVGPGGIGKTSISIALAERCSDLFADGAFFIDLITVDEALGLGATLAKSLHLRLENVDYTQAALDWLSDRNALLIFDNCEHVMEASAQMAEAILRQAPGVHILCTSRETLRVQDEWVHRLAPLDAPPPSGSLTTEEAMAYSAIELFVERASACRDSFTLSDEDAGHVSSICRSLDGIPLAIELAAARVDKLNVRSLAELLPQRLQILGPGKRTAKPHQQTLRATLDWSYELLAPRERTMLNRLAIFSNGFTLDAAVAVAGDPANDELDLTDSLFELIGKSLVSVEVSDDGDYYRLLETTKVYGREKLEAMGELKAISRRHAEFCLALVRRSREQWASEEGVGWVAAYDRWMDDISAAVNWAYTADSDAIELGIELAAMSAPLAVRLARLRGYLKHVSIALDRTRALDPPNPKLELRVAFELSYLLQHVEGDTEELRALSKRNSELFAKFRDMDDRVNALFFDFGLRFSAADWEGALQVADSYHALVSDVGADDRVTNGWRMRAQSFHYLGRHSEAVESARRVIGPTAIVPSTSEATMRVDPRVSSRVVMARSLWLLGRPDEATDVIYDCLALADKNGNNTLCQALAMGAAAVSIWSGDATAATRYCKAVTEVAEACGLEYWHHWGARIAALLAGRSEEVAALRVEPLMLDDFCTYDRRLVDPVMVARIEAGAAPWCAPEVLRAQVANLRESGRLDAAGSERLLLDAQSRARAQDALGWELRIVCDLAELALDRDDRGAAERLVTAVLTRFGGSGDTADIRRAAALLAKAG